MANTVCDVIIRNPSHVAVSLIIAEQPALSIPAEGTYTFKGPTTISAIIWNNTLFSFKYGYGTPAAAFRPESIFYVEKPSPHTIELRSYEQHGVYGLI